ncbi:hypothetical protein GCM10022251_63680 [Phytohabitans flavus]|uniref:PRC-barrel domain-containing protein n=1 Tax=Phytohabitans flavus TaxID=1076124 RepID=A0A6F8XV87_9ACTN|nr:hypothetical protein [Phytohabitans flavus]BCB77651.1 hypothetical protein Pflav_040610 [Phytohabitans flavus]
MAYTVLPDRAPVLDSDRVFVGLVEHVLADEGQDIFHGLIVRTPDGPRFADREQIAEMHSGGALLTVPGTDLREPSADPVAGDAERPVSERLQRAWEWLKKPQ